MVNQIDSIFAKAKAGAPRAVNGKSGIKSKGITKTSKTSGKVTALSKTTINTPKPKTKSGSSSDPFALSANQGKNSLDFTEEGWKVYTPAELNIGKGGDTELCPFDCDCCF
jgi:hypothetical protein